MYCFVCFFTFYFKPHYYILRIHICTHVSILGMHKLVAKNSHKHL